MAVTLVDTLLSLLFTFLIPPFIGVVALLVALAGLGKTLGVRQKYVDILLYIFDFGKQRLAKKEKLFSPDPSETDQEIKKVSSSNLAGTIFKSSLEECDKCEKHEFQLSDTVDYLCKGIEAIVDDEVTKRFAAEELTSWNFLTRTNANYEFISARLTVFWVIGFLFRYVVLLPLRICILFIGVGFLVTVTSILAILPEGKLRSVIGHYSFLMAFRIIARALSALIHYHDLENKPKSDGICVANHTSPIDCVILASHNVYAFVGQRHGGFLGIFQRALSRASDHIWFERGESKDRYAVAKRLREHVEDHNKMPILIFPEGTCINNTSVMQFKKGTFEVGGVIYPVAIKYDPRFGDAFWNSSKYAMLSYIYMMMTSWAIVCDVWYLPPMERIGTETSIQFANRVKAEIARRGGLVDLVWDGGLKRSAPNKQWKKQYQQEFSRSLKLHSTRHISQSENSDDIEVNAKIENNDNNDKNKIENNVQDENDNKDQREVYVKSKDDNEDNVNVKHEDITKDRMENNLNRESSKNVKARHSEGVKHKRILMDGMPNTISDEVFNNLDFPIQIKSSSVDNINNMKDNIYCNNKCSSEKINNTINLENNVDSLLGVIKCGKQE